MVTQIRCVDAARLGARATARGEDQSAVRGAIARELPRGRVEIGTSGGVVHVSVAAPIAGLPLLRSFVVHAEAEAADEGSEP